VVSLASGGAGREFLGSALLAPDFAFQPEEGQGVLELDFSREAAGDPNLMRGDAQGNTPVGLPILGVAVTDHATSTVIDADSRKAQPHRAITACSRHNGECR
jgi:hypothetical protein